MAVDGATAISDLLLDTIGGVWGKTRGESDVDVDVVRSTEFRTDGALFKASAVIRSVTDKQLQRRELRLGDILLEKSGGGPKQPVGRVAWVGEVDRAMVCANFVQLVRPDPERVQPRFLFYLLWFWHQTGRTLEFQNATTGIRNLRTPDYLAQRVGVPDLDEQRRLVEVLDAATQATERAEAYVASLEDMGRAQRQEFMTEGWTSVELREVVEVTMGRQRSPKHAAGDHLVPYLRAANVKDGRLALDDILVMNFSPDEQEKYRLLAGDVLVTEGCGSLSQIGASAWWDDEVADVVCFQNTLLRLRARPDHVDRRFLYHWARWAFESGAFAGVASGTNIFHIGAKRAAVMAFPLPDLTKQQGIGEALAAVEAAALAAQASRDRLAELRVSLLAAAFTNEATQAEVAEAVAA